VTLTCTGGSCSGFGPYVFATDDDGTYSLVKGDPGTGIALGTYTAVATRRGYLSATKSTNVTIAAGTNTISPTPTLRGGDADDNGTVDASDLTTVGLAFGDPPTTVDMGADINGDNIVNIFDLVLVGGNFGASSSNWP
jgi:hypothetical protein